MKKLLPLALIALACTPVKSFAGELADQLEILGVSTARMQGPSAVGIGSITSGEKSCANPLAPEIKFDQKMAQSSAAISSASASADAASMVGLPAKYVPSIDAVYYNITSAGYIDYDQGQIHDVLVAQKKSGCDILGDKNARMTVRVLPGTATIVLVIKKGAKTKPMAEAIQQNLGPDFRVAVVPIMAGDKATGQEGIGVIGRRVILDRMAINGLRYHTVLKRLQD